MKMKALELKQGRLLNLPNIKRNGTPFIADIWGMRIVLFSKACDRKTFKIYYFEKVVPCALEKSFESI